MVQARFVRTCGIAAIVAAFMVLASSTPASAQTSATIRGTIQDSSGGVLPGATVTLTNVGTKAVQSTVSDARGQYIVTRAVPRHVRHACRTERLQVVRAESPLRSARTTIAASTSGSTSVSRPKRSPSPSQAEVIQTQTGAREGLITSKQIENLSIIGRSALELMRILPGVVTDFNVGESVSFGSGGNNTQGYTVNGIRASGNTVSLDGSSLIDIGNNGGVIVSLNNDMVQEVKVQSSNFAAEYGTGGMNVSGVTKSGTSKFHGSFYDYWRDYRLAANDRSNSITLHREAEEHLSISGRQRRRPDRVRRQLHEEPRPPVLLRRLRRTAAEGGLGLALHAHVLQAMSNGDFSELLANRGSNLNSIPQLRIPQGYPNAGQPAPNNDMRPYVSNTGRYFASLYPLPNYSDPANLYNYVYSELEPTTATTSRRASTGPSATARAPTSASPTRARRPRAPAASGGPRPTSSRCRRRTSARTAASPTRATSSQRPEPDDDERSARQLQPADARQPLQGSQPAHAGRRRHYVPRHLPAGSVEPVPAHRPPARMGRAAARLATCGPRPTTCSRTTTRCSSATS